MSMARNRKGISFTLTLVVVGVVLLMTALVVIVGGGGSIMDFFQRGGEGSLDAAVSQACAQKAQQINSNYCSMYTDGDVRNDAGQVINDPSASSSGNCDVRRNPSSDYDTLVENSDNCNNWQDRHGDRLSDILDSGDPVVTVQGSTYNCLEEGELTTTCPA